MRPFGCHVTILNTLDPLEKFDRKADEGYFVGYSMNSKAFKVFNSRTRIVEETMHITFLENKPNVAGSGLTWLFDIDTLTKSMNYKPDVAENQSNGSAGEEEKKDAKDPENEDNEVLSSKERCQYPLEKFDRKADEGYFVGYSMNSKAFKVFNSRTRIVEETMHITFLENKPNVAGSGLTWLFDIDTLTKSMNYKPDVAENQSNGSAGEEEKKDAKDPENEDNEDNVVDKDIVYGCVDDPYMPNLEEINNSDDDEDVGVEANMTNLDSNILSFLF
nr:retrovirus-related Pol polyprotein from transposon TNT 1-94 [Tanacetum cinerariifolium]